MSKKNTENIVQCNQPVQFNEKKNKFYLLLPSALLPTANKLSKQILDF